MRILPLSLLALVAATAAAAQAGPEIVNRTFHGARLGMTVDQWRALAPPAGIEPDTMPNCSNELRTEKVAGARLSATEANSGVVTCTYATRFGARILPNSVQLDTGDTISDVEFRFSRDRLSEIRFQAPVAAWDDISGRLSAQYGRPALRGAVRRTYATWRTPEGWVTVTNPTGDATQLGVRYLSRSIGGADGAWNPSDPRLDH